MKYEEALKHCKEGKYVRRETWLPGEKLEFIERYPTMDRSGGMLEHTRSIGNGLYVCTWNERLDIHKIDIESQDWIVIEPENYASWKNKIFEAIGCDPIDQKTDHGVFVYFDLWALSVKIEWRYMVEWNPPKIVEWIEIYEDGELTRYAAEEEMGVYKVTDNVISDICDKIKKIKNGV